MALKLLFVIRIPLMREALSISELSEIEHRIEQIDRELDMLDPSNVLESQQIELRLHTLNGFIKQLEQARSSKPLLRLVC